MGAVRIVFESRHAAAAPAAIAPQVAPGRTGWGAAVDVGTTSLAVEAFDLASGRRIGASGGLNPQLEFGHDVLSRVSRALAGEAGLLREAVVTEAGRLIEQAGDGAPGEPAEIVVVGNPAMMHLFFGRDPTPLAGVPYTGALTEPLSMSATNAGLDDLGDARVRSGPGVSAFVGADAVAGLVATGLDRAESPAILVDLGTNGEIVLAHGDGFTAASAAAGPALEGVEIDCGMRAEPGAIERAEYAFGVLSLSTVGNAPARGICGSGLIDLGAALLSAGAIDSTGRMHVHGVFSEYFRVDDRGVRLHLTDDIYIGQHDIRQLQLAKGAIATAIAMVLEEAGVTASEVGTVVVGGAFGSHVDPAALAAIGMIPEVWTDRVSFGGNTALAGAAAMLLDPAALDRAAAVARAVRTVPLAARADFQMRFIGALDLPDLGPGT